MQFLNYVFPFKKLKINGESITLEGTWDTIALFTGHPDVLPQYNEYTLLNTHVLPTEGTYSLTDDYDINTGLKNINNNLIILYNSSYNKITFFMFTYHPTELQFSVGSSGNITQLVLYPGNGVIYHGQTTYSDLTRDSNNNGIPDCIDLDEDPTPRKWNFITRSESTLYENGKPWRFTGCNIHWLGLLVLIVNGEKIPTYPTHFEIEDALQTAYEMGINCVRSTTLGVSTGNNLSLEPSFNTFNDTAFDTIDYAISQARKYGIRLIIPLTDNYTFMNGGKHNFTEWRGLTEEDDFFTNSTVIQDFKDYISYLLNHKNKYTGIYLKDDPTILAWETGNELGTRNVAWGDTQDAWTEMIATYIKFIAPNHLVSDGRWTTTNTGVTFRSAQLANSHVDMYSDHFYPLYISKLKINEAIVTNANKVYFVGELDWTDKTVSESPKGTISQDTAIAPTGSYSARIDISQDTDDPKQNYYVQLQSNKFSLNASTAYPFSFYAKASNGNSIDVALQQNISPYTVFAKNTFILTDTVTQYTLNFSPTVNLSDVILEFNLAADKGSIWLDGISDSENLIINPSFEEAGTGWRTPWSFLIKSIGDYLNNFLTEVYLSGSAGSIFWDLYGHKFSHGFGSNDVYTFHYPGDTDTYKTQAQTLRNHSFKMREIKTIPDHILPVVPLINSVSVNGNSVTVDWRGTAGAATYNLETSNDGLVWSTVATGLIDTSVPATVSVSNSGTYFRLRPVSLDGIVSSLTSTAHAGSLTTFLKPYQTINGTFGVKIIKTANNSEIKTANGASILMRGTNDSSDYDN